MLFRISGGVYYQAPYYKEIKDLVEHLIKILKLKINSTYLSK